jgi:type IV pilus assembly protein PilF
MSFAIHRSNLHRSMWVAVGLVALTAIGGCANRQTEDKDEPPQSLTATNREDPLRYRAKVHSELGSNYFQRAQYSVAIEELNEAVRLDPKYGVAHGLLGLVHAELNEHSKAEAAFRRAIEVAPNEGDVRNNYGSYLCRQNRAKEGLEQFEAALRLPLYATPQLALENAGSCAIGAGQIRVAETYYQRLAQIQPLSSRGFQGLALVALKTAKMDDVRRFVAMGMRAQPLTAELLFYGACAEGKLGDRNAETSLTQMLRSRFPDSPFNTELKKGGCE